MCITTHSFSSAEYGIKIAIITKAHDKFWKPGDLEHEDVLGREREEGVKVGRRGGREGREGREGGEEGKVEGKEGEKGGRGREGKRGGREKREEGREERKGERTEMEEGERNMHISPMTSTAAPNPS